MKNAERDSVSRTSSDGCEEDVLSQLSHRGERPLSVLDLIERETFDLGLAAWLMSRVARGASFIVGANPGGVGKSTIMRALLDLVPGGLSFAVAMPGEIAGLDGQPHCLISHELSDHPPPAYLWDQDLRDFFALGEKGHVLVANMHADDLSEAREQIVTANGVPEAHFRGVGLFAFIRLEGDRDSGRRVIDAVHYSDGTAAHEMVYSPDNGLLARAPRDAAHEAFCRGFLEEGLAGAERTVEVMRRRFLGWEKERGGDTARMMRA